MELVIDMAYDFQFEDGMSFGDWLHKQLKEAVHFEEEKWALDRGRQVQNRLQSGRPPSSVLLVEIPWMEEETAFTAPGRYIYCSRRLFERCPEEEHLAFVVAHEIAHHDLGHVEKFSGWAAKLLRVPGADLLTVAVQAGKPRILARERVRCKGMDGRCLTAGITQRCLSSFELFREMR